MKTLDEISEEATRLETRLVVNTAELNRVVESSADALFQTPLLALTILVIARERRAGFATSDVATFALATLVRHSAHLGLKRNRIQLSVPLRRRCADALVFLDNARMIVLAESGTRTISLTSFGQAFIGKQSRGPDETGLLVRRLHRAYGAVEHVGLELL